MAEQDDEFRFPFGEFQVLSLDDPEGPVHFRLDDNPGPQLRRSSTV